MRVSEFNFKGENGMKIVEPFVGERVGQVCRRIYFMMQENSEPIITHFNEVAIMFTNDKGGFHYKDLDIDHVKLERIRGLTDKELIKRDREWWENRCLESKARRDKNEN